MLKSGMGVLVFLLLHGCTTKDEKSLLHTYEANKTYHKQLQKTQNILLKNDGVTVATLTATYLYDAKHKKSDERFVVGIYAEESGEQDYLKGGYTLSLDDGNGSIMKPLRITHLDKNSAYLKNISFVTSWNRFYLVTFPHTAKKSFDLIFTTPHDGSGRVYFAKVAKYTLENTKK